VEEVLATVNARNANGLSALWVAVNRGDERAISLLTTSGAAFGAMPPVATRTFEPPPHKPALPSAVASVSDGRRDSSKSATTDKATPTLPALPRPEGSARGQTEGEAAMARAAAAGDVDVLLSLAALGESLDSADAFGETPLRLVCVARAEAGHRTAFPLLTYLPTYVPTYLSYTVFLPSHSCS
jgi:hypothetical protein